jgi:hypothetical protein
MVGERLSIRSGTQLPHPLKLAPPSVQLLLVLQPCRDTHSEIREVGLLVEQFATDTQPVLDLLVIHGLNCRPGE